MAEQNYKQLETLQTIDEYEETEKEEAAATAGLPSSSQDFQKNLLNKLSNFKDLITTPYMLSMILEILPTLET